MFVPCRRLLSLALSSSLFLGGQPAAAGQVARVLRHPASARISGPLTVALPSSEAPARFNPIDLSAQTPRLGLHAPIALTASPAQTTAALPTAAAAEGSATPPAPLTLANTTGLAGHAQAPRDFSLPRWLEIGAHPNFDGVRSRPDESATPPRIASFPTLARKSTGKAASAAAVATVPLSHGLLTQAPSLLAGAHTTLASFQHSVLWFAAIGLPISLLLANLRKGNDSPVALSGWAKIIFLVGTPAAIFYYALGLRADPVFIEAVHSLSAWGFIKTGFLLGAAKLAISCFTAALAPSNMSTGKSVKLPGFLGLLMLAAIEEIFFRGVLFGGLSMAIAFFLPTLSLSTAFIVAAVISAAIFSALHGYGDFWTRFLGGVAWASIYFVSGSLVLTILSHFFHNWILAMIGRVFASDD